MDATRRILEALFHAASDRAPDALERGQLDEIASLLVQDESDALVRGLEALGDGVDAEGELDECAWTWVLRDVARYVPGIEYVDGAQHDQLRVDRSGRSLRLDRTTARWSTAAPVECARTLWLVDEGPAGHVLEIDDDTRALLRTCEIHCVAGCCGLGAFEIAPKWMLPWIDEVGPERAVRLAQALRDAVVATESLPSVRSMDLNAWFTRSGECSRHLALWADALETALASR